MPTCSGEPLVNCHAEERNRAERLQSGLAAERVAHRNTRAMLETERKEHNLLRLQLSRAIASITLQAAKQDEGFQRGVLATITTVKEALNEQ